MASVYADSPVTIRADLAEAHRATIEAWARPGNHWSGAERVAVVAQVRRARAAEPLPAWVAPSTVEGLTPGDGVLPEAAVDAIWRLANHPGTLTEDWYRSIIERGPAPAGRPVEPAYVELVGLVATAVCVDTFARAMGIEPAAVPAPVAGEPDRRVEPGAVVSTHWVPTVPGRGPNVGRALSAVPVAVAAWRRLSTAQYVPAEALVADLAWSRGALDRSQVELLAARTSLLNECFY